MNVPFVGADSNGPWRGRAVRVQTGTSCYAYTPEEARAHAAELLAAADRVEQDRADDLSYAVSQVRS